MLSEVLSLLQIFILLHSTSLLPLLLLTVLLSNLTALLTTVLTQLCKSSFTARMHMGTHLKNGNQQVQHNSEGKAFLCCFDCSRFIRWGFNGD